MLARQLVWASSAPRYDARLFRVSLLSLRGSSIIHHGCNHHRLLGIRLDIALIKV